MRPGGAIYSTSDGWNSTLAYNHLDGDPVQYGVIYHDGGSANWHDTQNVIENARTSCIFAHGSWCDAVDIVSCSISSLESDLRGRLSYRNAQLALVPFVYLCVRSCACYCSPNISESYSWCNNTGGLAIQGAEFFTSSWTAS